MLFTATSQASRRLNTQRHLVEVPRQRHVAPCRRLKTGTAVVCSLRTETSRSSFPSGRRWFCAATEAKETTPPKSGTKQALFALPLFRKPAFPGFYHVIQVGDTEILEFLHLLRQNGQNQVLGGFMTVELPQDLADKSEVAAPLVATPAQTPSSGKGPGSKSLRKDTGRIDSAEELLEVGTCLQVVSIAAHPGVPGGQVVVMPTHRIRRVKTLSTAAPGSPLCLVDTEALVDVQAAPDNADVKALHQEMIATMKELLKIPFMFKEQFKQVIQYYNLDDPLKLADLVTGMSKAPREDLQAVLVENDAVERLRKVLIILKQDLEHYRLQSHFRNQIEEKFAKDNRKYFLMQQLREIKRELGLERDDKQTIISAFTETIAKFETVPEEAKKAMDQELSRLSRLEPQVAEFNITRTYLEWLTSIPWGQTTQDNIDITKAEAILNEDHYSLEDVKERILEHMAVSFLKGSTQGKIICLVGPPGVGKTSIGKSIARALDRKFFRFSVGGLHDVAEIRGHRRTYIGAMPGKVIQALKITKVLNPVILIDEVDKLGRDFRGDPSSALLEVLDPEQNNNFRDLYMDVPVDLSKVLFVCTANVLDTIPGPLLDRMEVIRLAGYVFEEKLAIANQYLIPQTISSHGIREDLLKLDPDALAHLIRDYAREAGVRELRKLLEKIARKVALSLIKVEEEKRQLTEICFENLRKFVGQPPHTSDQLFPDGTPSGVVMGLAWTSLGGKTLFVEARGRVPRARSQPAIAQEVPKVIEAEAVETTEPKATESSPSRPPRSGPRMKVTGKLGKVMGESSEIAYTYARLFLREIEPPNDFLDTASVHMNLPEGATPKDGPSAGITMTSALISLALDRPVKPGMAMSGEVTLTGKVLRVGGIKEKALAARRENVGMILLPMSNQADYLELKPHLRAGLTAHFVDHYDDIYRLAFEDSGAPMLPSSRGSEVVTIFTPAEEGLNPLGLTEESAPTVIPPTSESPSMNAEVV
jgi:ATP-dependent Lon protease